MLSFFDTIRFILAHPVGRYRPLPAIARYIRWQAAVRLAPGRIVVDWLNGAKLVVGFGEHGMTGNIYCGLHEFDEMSFLLHYLRPGSLFFDIGANAGSYTVLASAVVGATTWAFEPAPHAFARLCDNVHINNLGERVRCENVAVGERLDSVRVTASLDCINHVICRGPFTGAATVTPMVSLDGIRGELVPELIKIDVEGYEVPVLRGAPTLLASGNLQSVIVERNGSGARYGFEDHVIVDLLTSHGFTAVVYHARTRTLVPDPGGSLAGPNAIFVRDLEIVGTRLRNASVYSVHGLSV